MDKPVSQNDILPTPSRRGFQSYELDWTDPFRCVILPCIPLILVIVLIAQVRSHHLINRSFTITHLHLHLLAKISRTCANKPVAIFWLYIGISSSLTNSNPTTQFRNIVSLCGLLRYTCGWLECGLLASASRHPCGVAHYTVLPR